MVNKTSLSAEVLPVAVVITAWAFPGTFVRLMPALNPWVLASLRLLIAFLSLVPFLSFGPFRSVWRDPIRRKECWAVASLMTIYYLTATAAFQNAPVGEVALLIASAPVMSLVIRKFRGHSMHAIEVLGAALALVGVTIVAAPALISAPASHGNHALGVILSLLAAVCSAAFALSVKSLANRGVSPGPVPLAGMAFLLGTPLLLSLLIPGQWSLLHDWRTSYVIPLGAFSTALPTAMYAVAAGRLSPVVASMINPLTAVMANAASALTIGEIPHLRLIPAGMLIVTGMVIVSKPRREEA